MSKQTIFDGLDPEIIERVGSRRDALRGLGKLGVGAALASVPLAFGAMAKEAFAQGGLPAQVVQILNYALTLEYLEAEFYTRGVASTAITFPENTKQVFTIIRDHEQAHVAALQGILGAQAVAKPTFTFEQAFPTIFTDYATFVTVAQAFEDTGVRAYKGRAVELIPFPRFLQLALTVHSVEARHASKVRRLAASPAMQGWIALGEATSAPAPIRPVYQGEDEVIQLGVNVPQIVGSGVTAEDVAESFDEPLTPAQVFAIVDPFIQGDVDGDGTET